MTLYTLYVSNIGISMIVLKTLKILSCLYARNMLNIMMIVQNVKCDCIRLSYLLYFYHVADKEIVK